MEELGLAQFFGSGGVGAPRSKRAPSRRNSNNAKDIVRYMPMPSTELQIEDVSSNHLHICAPTPGDVAEEDDMNAAKDDIDGETGSESNTGSDVLVLNSQLVQYRASRPDYPLQKPEAQAGMSKKSRPVRQRVDENNQVGYGSSGLKTESGPGHEAPPLARELRSLSKRVYRDSPDVDFDVDYDPVTYEKPSKKPRKR